MGRCRCDPISVAGCQCSFQDSEAINFSGTGSNANPLTALPILDPSSDNLTTYGASGILSELPPLYKSPPRCMVSSTQAQTIPANLTPTIILWTHSVYDSAGGFDPSTDEGVIVIPADGLYIIHFMISVGHTSGDAEPVYLAEVLRNRTDLVLMDKEVQKTHNIGSRLHNSRDVQMSANDDLRLRVTSGSTTDEATNPVEAENYLSYRWVAPLTT